MELFKSDKAVNGLDSTLKSVNDCITTAENWVELKDKSLVLFRMFRELNRKVKPSKLWLGTKVKFGGFECKNKEGEVSDPLTIPEPNCFQHIIIMKF